VDYLSKFIGFSLAEFSVKNNPPPHLVGKLFVILLSKFSDDILLLLFARNQTRDPLLFNIYNRIHASRRPYDLVFHSGVIRCVGLSGQITWKQNLEMTPFFRKDQNY